MNQKIKNYLGWALVAGIIIGAYSLWRIAESYADASEPISYRTFSVSGEGRVATAPDTAEFSFKVITEGSKDVGALQRENTQKINAAVAFMKSNGVEAKNIKTETYSVEPRYQYSACPAQGGVCPPAVIVGYTITSTVSVKTKDFSKVGALLEGAVAEGANSVSALSFTIENPDVVEAQARGEAIRNAKEKAEAIAKTGGFRIGRIVSISEGSYPVPMFSKREMALGMGGDAAQSIAPAIEPGSEKVTVQVMVTYEIK